MIEANHQTGTGEFKTHCLKLIDRVNQTKQHNLILLTRDRKILQYGSEGYLYCLEV